MPQQVCAGALIRCSFGVASIPLIVLPTARVTTGVMPAATIMDSKPFVNIATFGMCSAPTNPTVIAATAAALGVFTPMPCIPATGTPWITGNPTVLLGNMPALNNTSTCMCTWLGVVTINTAGQFTVMD